MELHSDHKHDVEESDFHVHRLTMNTQGVHVCQTTWHRRLPGPMEMSETEALVAGPGSREIQFREVKVVP